MIISKKDTKLLEDLIIRHGRIVSFEDIRRVFVKEYSSAGLKNHVSLLAKTGWLVRIKRGLYMVVTDIGSLKSGDISIYAITQALNRDSYISFENALQYHGMFDQMLATVGAVTFKRARRYKVKDSEIRFFRVKKSLYFGFTSQRSDIGLVNMADKEKAILDILYFRSNAYYASLVWEKLSEYKDDFDFDLMKRYAKRFGFDIVRKMGFFLDRLGVATGDLEQLIAAKTSYGRMTKESKKFDSKWRLYFDDSIID